MNEELIKQCARDAANRPHRYAHEIAEHAIRLYHARHVAPLVAAADRLMAFIDQEEAWLNTTYAYEELNIALAPFQQEAK